MVKGNVEADADVGQKLNKRISQGKRNVEADADVGQKLNKRISEGKKTFKPMPIQVRN